MCDNCERRYGFNVSTCGGNASIAADRYVALMKDEWLQRAAEEITDSSACEGRSRILAILRKHRDAA
jgi:hypothetical protein